MAKKKELEELLSKQRREAEERSAKRRAEKYNLNYIDLVSVTAPTEIKAMELVKEKTAKEAFLAPVQLIGKKLIIAVYNPQKQETKEIIDELRKQYDVSIVIASKFGLEHNWSYYKYIKEKGKKITGGITIDSDRINTLKQKINTISDLSKEIQSFSGTQTSQILEIILGGGIALQASDVHLEPGDKKNIFRLRVDGMLHNISSEISKKTHNSIITRIKLLSNLKLNIKNKPQDGRFTIKLPDRDIEIRTSIIPSEYGETVVLRLLDPESLKVNLEDLGWRKDDLEIIKKEVSKPNGLILNTGPTGSGKTTTLYAFLRKKVKPEIKIITIEDPIEYHIEGISQSQVNRTTDYTFANGLRSILRQDPDIILIGEIRDEETAKIALNASLTGHMVFSTLHTNHAVGAIPRLLDLGSQPNILGPAISVIIAQRLVRKLCDNCKTKVKLNDETKGKINKFLEGLPERVNTEEYKNFEVYESKGCEKCNGTGYKGRTSIFELFTITDSIEEEIYKNPTEIELKNLAKKQGMVFTQEDGILKTLKGITSFEEVERLTGPIEWLDIKFSSKKQAE